MAEVKISELAHASNVQGTELIPMTQNGATRTCTPNQIIEMTGVSPNNVMGKNKIRAAHHSVATSQSIPNNADTTLTTIAHTNSYAVYVVNVTWAASADGERTVSIGNVTVRAEPCFEGGTRMQAVFIASDSGDYNIPIVVKQNSGGALNCTCSYDVIRFNVL